MGTIYHSNNSYGKSIDSPASDIILSSVMHIGGETQNNAEDAIVALSENSGGNDLEDLSDVSVDNPVEGDYLKYDGTANIWINHMSLIPDIVTWADGTDAEIAAMLEAHYAGYIDVTDYWSVGDERTVSLSAMSATEVGESHVAQDVTMVLMNEGGKTLVTPINNHTECVFIVGQKDCLKTKGYMNSSDINAGGWDSCVRRTWCNNIYKNAFSSTIIGIFKEHQNITGQGSTNQTLTTISNDYFALPSEKEIFGSTTYANATAEASNTQFKYYETSANRQKNINGYTGYWWSRSPSRDAFSGVYNDGTVGSFRASVDIGIAPFGVI